MKLLLLEIGISENKIFSKVKRIVLEINIGYVVFYLFCLKRSIVLEIL